MTYSRECDRCPYLDQKSNFSGENEHDRAELENREQQFDIIIGDLADPVAGGPCYRLYTKSFYESILKSRLKHGGILVTQVGPYPGFPSFRVLLSLSTSDLNERSTSLGFGPFILKSKSEK